jgi:hypothetical protein
MRPAYKFKDYEQGNIGPIDLRFTRIGTNLSEYVIPAVIHRLNASA